MDYKGNIIFIISHSKFDGSNNHLEFILTEPFLYIPVEFFSIHAIPGIVGFCRNATAFQKISQVIAIPLSQTVDDSASGKFGNRFQNPGITLGLAGLIYHLNIKRISGQWTSGNEDIFSELGLKIRDYTVVGSSCCCQYRNIFRQLMYDFSEISIFKSKIVSPIGNTMRFINYKKANPDIGKPLLHICAE